MKELSIAESEENSAKYEDVVYKGYVIEPAPYSLAENRGWVVNLCIASHSENGVIVKGFPTKNVCNTEKEAVMQCVLYGKRIIDGEYPALRLDTTNN